jgi:hypothetical protein
MAVRMWIYNSRSIKFLLKNDISSAAVLSHQLTEKQNNCQLIDSGIGFAEIRIKDMKKERRIRYEL